MNVNNSCPVVASTIASMCGNGKGSFGQALFRYVKSIQTRHFPFFFCTTTTLANQSGYLTFLILPVLSRLSTSSWITLLRSLVEDHHSTVFHPGSIITRCPAASS